MGRRRMAVSMVSSRAVVLLIALVSCALRASAEDVKSVAVEGRIMAPMGSATAVHLNAGKYSAFVRADGTFKVHGVPAGTAYVLQVVSSSMVFDQVRVSVMKNGDVRASLMFPSNKRGSDSVNYPLFLEPKGRMSFFEVREGFNFGMLYKNPMVLMMGFSCVMMFMMKYMVDPEQMKEMQSEMAEQGIESQGDMLKAMMSDPEKLTRVASTARRARRNP